jgi:hypothetical protein
LVKNQDTAVGNLASSGAIKGSSASDLMVGAASGKKLLLASNDSATESVTLDTAGKVGIGTTSPTTPLTVVGQLANSGGGSVGAPAFTEATNLTTGMFFPAASQLAFGTDVEAQHVSQQRVQLPRRRATGAAVADRRVEKTVGAETQLAAIAIG